MKSCSSITTNIFVGLREAYSDTIQTLDAARDILHNYCDSKGLCVSLTPTEFIYTSSADKNIDGFEPRFIVGLINYPLYPSTPEKIYEHECTGN